MFRKIDRFPAPKLFLDDYDLYTTMLLDARPRIAEEPIMGGNIPDMTEGEIQIDFQNKRKVIKIKGKLYTETVENNEVKLTKLED